MIFASRFGRFVFPCLFASTLGACAHAPPPASTDRAPEPVERARPLAPEPEPLHLVERLRDAPAPACGSLEPFGARRAADVLGGRLLVRMPDDAQRATGGDTDERPSGLSRVRVARGATSLSLVLRETLSLPGENLASYALAASAGDTPFGELAETAIGAFRGVVVENGDAAPQAGSFHVARAFVVSTEGTVIDVDIGISTTRDAPVSPTACIALARGVLASLADGANHLDRSGGVHAIGELLTLDVPAGTITFPRYSGEVSFVVPAPIGEPISSLTVEVTEHPPVIEMPIDRAGPYLGRTVSWRNLYGDGIERRSALMHIPRRAEYARSTAEAPTVEGVQALMDLAGRIRVRR